MFSLSRAFHHADRPAHSSLPGHPVLRLLVLIVLALAVPVAAMAGGVYVAEQGRPLAQTMGQALADNPHKSDKPFWIVVAGADAGLLTRTRSTQDLRQMLKTAKERGAEVYVCRSDLVRAGIRDEELLDGVVSMYGYGPQDWSGLLPARKDGIALPSDMAQSQRILNTCAVAPATGS
ncbi:DsrE family protein [Noviherbaspirillum denitrificans]|uniref:DsrE/DsrF-like family protein n=1 Tax=Noviherbaspirillum denitrificans TaxID=1968433 RepID=A0A254TDE2_9BURK|nr:DsrE family protein [Noviherbaspirillum denitrificans]OWW20666.1 hypothetical protein AYR66_15420 [Noviherbaspirillum denitrificans]